MKFEGTVLPVADVERAKAVYQDLGWRLDADISVAENYPIMQFTPPGSPASIQRGSSQEAASAAAGSYMAEAKHIVV